MAHLGLITRTKPILLLAPVSKAAAAYNMPVSGGVDTLGWNGLQFELMTGVMTATGTIDAKLQDSTDNFAADIHDIPGCALVQIVDTGGGKIYIIEAWHPTRRYVRAVMTVATAASIVGAKMTLYESNGITLPVPKDTSVAQAVLIQVN